MISAELNLAIFDNSREENVSLKSITDRPKVIKRYRVSKIRPSLVTAE